MLPPHLHSGNHPSQDRQARTGKQCSSVRPPKAQEQLRFQNKAKNESMTTYARATSSATRRTLRANRAKKGKHKEHDMRKILVWNMLESDG